jgi:N6-adenosine-specific RNA methylase IME4/DNA-binding XRE family transcriptional regulator
MKIDNEFKDLIPELAPAELLQLEENIKRDGCRDPLVLWNGVLVDGHNRYDICKRNDLPFKTIDRAFENRSEVIEWIITNQFGRRSLNNYVRGTLALRLESEIAARAKVNQKTSSGGKNPQLMKISTEAVTTREELAKIAGISNNTIDKIKKIEEKGSEEAKKSLAKGEISINEAHKQIKNAEKKQQHEEDVAKQKEDIATGKAVLPSGVFEIVVLDPPWNYGRKYDPEGSRVANPYPEMKQDELLKMEIPFAKDSVVFLWTTHQFIFDAKELLNHWGFEYKATMVWDKEKIGMGSWLRMQCEFCLVAVKGKPKWNNTTWRDIIRESRRQHSRKPDAFYQMVDEVTIGRKLEYFSREKREGWETFGNDTDKF